ncbi:MAG TPA: hypothetical protein VLM89_10625 [Phycisphaerae bacterium]|nr:hypothetical protein [Phycisphaerae bacterium]
MIAQALYQRIENRLHQRTQQLRKDAARDLPDDLFDSLFTHLGAVIEIVAGIKDYSTEPYLDKLRAVVCAECSADPSGNCVRRNAGMCGLNDYFPIIVGTIEQELKNDTGQGT